MLLGTHSCAVWKVEFYVYLRESLKETFWQLQGPRKFTSLWFFRRLFRSAFVHCKQLHDWGKTLVNKVYFYGFSRTLSTKSHCMVRRAWVLITIFFNSITNHTWTHYFGYCISIQASYLEVDFWFCEFSWWTVNWMRSAYFRAIRRKHWLSRW